MNLGLSAEICNMQFFTFMLFSIQPDGPQQAAGDGYISILAITVATVTAPMPYV